MKQVLWRARAVFALALISSLTGTVFAQSESTARQSRDSYLEQSLVGSVTAAVAAVAGATLVSMGFNCPVGLAGIDCAFTATLVGESVGAVLGAAVGVGYIGMQRHIRGNLLLTVLGGALGVVFGTVLGIFAPSFPLLAFISVGAGFGAALGYNSGITMKVKTLSFSNQGLELAGIQLSW